ncbi:MAG: bifunctional folylpolyglutamate synthase/dihydrofolate synthase [Verrucomicrobiota bacterium]
MQPPFRDFEEVRRYLYALKSHGAKYGIDRMRALVERLGHPERQFPVIHVAGTNGKGSTVALLEAIHRAAGRRTGMFTSPHLVYQGERVQVDRTILPHDEIVRLTNELAPLAEEIGTGDPDLHPSFFEFMTAMAFLRFAQKGVDIGLIETGLGGRLDATNVVQPELTIITSVGLDHTEFLGETHAAIAAEKAGILKAGAPVVIGQLPAEAEAVVRARAAELGCPVHSVRERFGETLEAYPVCGLAGDYQRLNAGVAVLATEVLQARFPVPPAAVEAGLAQVEWAGRWDRRDVAGRTLVLDSTHNEEGATHLHAQLARLVAETGQRPLVVAGALGAARAQALLEAVAGFAREIHLLRPKQPRACSWEALEEAVPASFTGPVRRRALEEIVPSPGVLSLGEPGDVVVATGSIYLIGEILEALTLSSPAGEGALQD